MFLFLAPDVPFESACRQDIIDDRNATWPGLHVGCPKFKCIDLPFLKP